jgi:hypothetical protein
MKDKIQIINGLENSPSFLINLLNEIPHDLQKLKRVENKWTIYEHACQYEFNRSIEGIQNVEK